MTVNEYISDGELFHFVGRSLPSDEEKYLLLTRNILQTKSLRHPPFGDDDSIYGYTVVLNEDKWTGSLEQETQGLEPSQPIFKNIICFADIPYRLLANHMSKYSKFGLSFNKKYLAERGARPVLYYPVWQTEPYLSIHGTPALGILSQLLKRFCEGEFKDDNDLQRDIMMKFFAYIKPFDVDKSLTDPENYYTEREWRLLGYLKFGLHDIQRVILPEVYHSRLLDEFPELRNKLTSPE